MANPTTADPPKKKSKVKLVLLFVFIFIFLLVAIYAFWFFAIRDPGDPSTFGGEDVHYMGSTFVAQIDTPSVVVDTPRTPLVVQLPSITVNLRDIAYDRYLRLGIEVEVSNPEAVREIQQNQARIRDALILLLSSKTSADLATAEGKLELKEQIAARINHILGTPRVIRIYYTDFVIT